METKLLYLENSYLKEFDATITSIQEKKVELDQTAFYPESGGQLGDKGAIVCNNHKYQVLNTKKEQGKAIHYLNSSDSLDELRVGDKVHCILDWPFRYKMMRMHTAAHIISGIINKEAQALITGNQLGQEKSRIDYDLEKFDREQMKVFIEKADKIAQTGMEVTSYTITRQEAESKPWLCKLAKGLPPAIQEIRILKIGDVDEQPDGGTHVKNTSEIGKIVYLDVENKGATRRRVYFTLEN